MTQYESLPPGADLIDSMRHIGYSLDTALADIIDNSVAASCSNVWVMFDAADETIAILDDGDGMDKSTLRSALRFAGTPTSKVRGSKDLGRFGLGLKTASFSQASLLTVLTKTSSGSMLAAEWNLDVVREQNDWLIKWLDQDEISGLPYLNELASKDSGTLVIWRNLDVLLAGYADTKLALTEVMSRSAEHLSLVFHRYMASGPSDRVNLFLNETKLKPIDPFFTGNQGTQKKPAEDILVEGHNVVVTAYILPNLSKLSTKERQESDFLNSRFIDTQGFYIYRQRRLITFGTWFRIAPKSELSKMARVMVEITPSMDSLWKLGVMKSTLDVPSILRKRLKEMVPEIVNESKKVIQKSGALNTQGPVISAWQFREIGRDAFTLEISDSNPFLNDLVSTLNATQVRRLGTWISQLEMTFPVTELVTRITGDQSHTKEGTKPDYIDYAKSLLDVFIRLGSSAEVALESLKNVPPFVDDLRAKDALNAGSQTLMDYLERGTTDE